MNTFRSYLRNWFTIFTIAVYIFVMLFQSVPFINIFDSVYAEDASEKNNIALVFVDSKIYNDIKPELSWYASYIQQWNQNTKAVLFPIDASHISSHDIHRVIENLYFDWEKSKTSFLKTIVLIWDVPLPVVNKDWFIFPTIYPYVDIVKPSFVYDHWTKYFRYNGKASNVEIAHWLIKFDKTEDYKKYFRKLRNYASNPSAFVEKKFYVDNFVLQSQSYNFDLSKYYLNRIVFAENLITRKITPLILKVFNEQNKQNYNKIMEWAKNPLTTQQKPQFSSPSWVISSFLWMNKEQSWEFSKIQEEYASKTQSYFSNMKELMKKAKDQDNNYFHTPTLTLESALKWFFKNYIWLYWNEYPSNLTKNIEATGRYTWTNTVSSLNVIDIKDDLSVNYIKTINDSLEASTDVQVNLHYASYPVLDKYIIDPDWTHTHTVNKWWWGWSDWDWGDSEDVPKTFCQKQYENFYFWKSVSNVTWLKGAHIFRWTYWNHKNIWILKESKSRWLRSTSSVMNEVFDMQAWMNRWYNTLNAKPDGDEYKDLCSRLKWINPLRTCSDLKRHRDTEQVDIWAKRIYWWYSPLNIKERIDPTNIIFKFEDYKQAWTPSYAKNKDGTIFDTAWSAMVKSAESKINTDTVLWFTNYASVWKTITKEEDEDNEWTCVVESYHHWESKIAWKFYDYNRDFDKIYTNVPKWWSCWYKEIVKEWNWVVLKNYFWEEREDWYCKARPYKFYYFQYKDTRVKHTSPTNQEFDWFTMTTMTRPVDSRNYIAFLGKNWKNIEFTYPNIFAVDVYKKQWSINILKSPQEISTSIISYLLETVDWYNAQIWKWSIPRDYFVKKLWDQKIANLSEMLYYLNLWWKKKPSFSDLSSEIDYLYKNFDVNEKIEYVVWNYMDSENPYKINYVDLKHDDISFPIKADNWYEAWFIWSKHLDNLQKPNVWWSSTWIPYWTSVNSNLLFSSFQWFSSPLPSTPQENEECGKPLWEAVIIFKWPAAFMCRLQETMKKPFKIWSTNECSWWSCSWSAKDFVNKLKDSWKDFVNEWKEYLWMSKEQANDKRNRDYSEEDYMTSMIDKRKFFKLKETVDNNIRISTNKKSYDYNDLTWSINIINYWDISILDSIKVRSYTLTWNCFYIKNNNSNSYKNTCKSDYTVDKSDWKIPFNFYNPKTQEWRYYSYKAWQRIIALDFCTQDNICYTKRLFFDKLAWKLAYAHIKPFSDTMVYWWENPFVIEWFDSKSWEWRYQNPVYWTYYNYKLSLNPWIWLIQPQIWQAWSASLDYNFSSSNKLMLVKTDKSIKNINKFNISLDLDETWKKTFADDSSLVKHVKSKQIYIASKSKLEPSDAKILPSNYDLPDSPNSIILQKDWVKFYDKSKLPRLHIKPKVNWKNIKTPFKIKDKNWNFIPWVFVKRKKTIQENWVKKILEYDEFVKQDEFLIDGEDWVYVYLLPTFKTWPYDISVNIPWIDRYSIRWKLSELEPERIFVKLDKYQADPDEIVNWKIFALDKFWNLQENISSAKITSTDWLSFTVSWNDIKIKWKETWFLQMKVWDFENNVQFSINNSFVPYNKKLSVMYLTLLWYDWWKYSKRIMASSDKNLSITTTSLDPQKLQKFDYILGQDMSIVSSHQTKLVFDWSKVVFNAWWININYDWNFFSNIAKVASVENISRDWIYYIAESPDNLIKTNVLNSNRIYVNWEEVLNFGNLTHINSLTIVYNKTLTENTKVPAYDILFNRRKIWSIYFKWSFLDLSKLSVNKPLLTKNIFWGWTTNWNRAFWVIMNNAKYSWISSNTSINITDDKWIWFRSNFRNITNFAWWLSVWESSKWFQNELLINYWDPFVKRISSEPVISDVSLSKTYWHRIYSDIAWWIKKVVPIDFNNDWLKDIAILYNNSTIRLLKHYKWQTHFEDLWNLMVLAKPATDIFAWDYNWDGYQDIFVKFDDNTVRVYKNDHWVFSVDPYPICLDVVWSDGMHFITEQIFFRDMNNDWKTDIVTNDLWSNVKVFFWPSYVSSQIHKCDSNRKSKLSQKLVKSYSYKVSSNSEFMDDWYIYWKWLWDSPNWVWSRPMYQEAFKNQDFSKIPQNAWIDPTNHNKHVMTQAWDKFAYQDIPKDLWPSFENIKWDTIEFKKWTFLLETDPVWVYKTMKDLNGWTLKPWDKVRITVHVNNKQNKKLTYLETLKWPFAVISKNDEPILTYEWISPKNISFPKQYQNFLFRIDDVSWSFTVSYEAYFKWWSSISIKVDDFTKNKYWDIKVFLWNWCIKWYDFFKWKSWVPMEFDYSYENIKQKLIDKISRVNKKSKTKDIMSDAKDWNYKKLLSQFKVNNSNDAFNASEFAKSIAKWETVDLNISIWSAWVWAIKWQVDKMLQWLCKWFSFSKADCWGWIPVPCNFAFLAPWMINVCWCPAWTDPWTPIFWFPGTKWFVCGKSCSCTAPVPMMKTISWPPTEKSAPSWCNSTPVYDSKIRLYLAPTLTMWLGFAACFGSYQKWMRSPPAPVWAIAWNCVVVAADVSWGTCEEDPENKDKEDEIDDWMNDMDNWVCSDMSFFPWRYNFSPLWIPGWTSFESSNISPTPRNWRKVTALNGMVKFEMTAHKINSLADAEVLMKWWIPFTLNTEQWTFKWIIQCIIKKWMNKQIQFLISNLTHMTVYVNYPDMSWFFDWLKEKDRSAFDFDWSGFGDIFSKFRIWEESKWASWTDSWIYKTISKYLPSKDWLKDVSKWLSSPFDAIKSYLEEIPLVNVSLKTVVIKVPWIWKDELDKQITYMKNRVQKYMNLIESCTSYVSWWWSNGQCDLIKHNFKQFVRSVQKNIEMLERYRDFPLQLEKYMNALDKYLEWVSCIIDKYVDMVIGWINRNSKIFEKRVDAIVAIINAIRTWQLLIDVSLDWKMTCWKCRVDAGDLYDCTLSGLCIDLPVLPIPPFKIPDIFIDFSHINLWIDVILPKIRIYPVPIGLFTLPEFSVPSVNIRFPTLPTIPAPPKLPDLPCLPAIPTVELPNLPPPPKIPKLMPAIKAVLEVFKLVSYFRCIIKNWIWLVAERNVKTRIEQLTARHNRIFPFDFLNIDFPILPFYWFDVRIDAYLNYRVEFSMIFDAVKSIADWINNKTSNSIWKMLKMNLENNKKMDSYNKDWKEYDLNLDLHSWIDKKKRALVSPKEKRSVFVINKEMSTKVAKGVLYDQISYFISQKWEDYLNSISNSSFQKAEKIRQDALHDSKVKWNVKWVEKLKDKFKQLIQEQYRHMSEISKVLKQMRRWENLDTSNKDIFVSWNSDLVSNLTNLDQNIKFKTNILTLDEKSTKILKNAENPRLSYLKMYWKALSKFKDKIQTYKNWKPESYYAYNQLEKPVNKSLAKIESVIWKQYAMESFGSSDDSADSSSYFNSSSAITIDPSQNIKWLFMRWNWDSKTYYNIMKDKQKWNKIRTKKTFFVEDMNDDSLNDLIWYDNNSIYIKYSKDEPKKDWVIYSKKYIYTNIVKDFSKIVDNDWYVHINDSKFKIWDKTPSVTDVRVFWQTLQNFRLLRTKVDSLPNSYTVVYSKRIDILDDIEKKFNKSADFTYVSKDFKKHAVVFYDNRIKSLSWVRPESIRINWLNSYSVELVPNKFEDKSKFWININRDYIRLQEWWKYFRVYNSIIDPDTKKLKILSSYSNQDVWAEQFIWDDTEPTLTPELIRTKTNDVVWTWVNLTAYVNTSYILRWTWEDDSWIESKFISNEKFEFIKTWDTIDLWPLQNKSSKIFYFIAKDLNWNVAKNKVTVNFTVPKIKITDLDSKKWIVESKILQDMDDSAVKYLVDQNWVPKIVKNLQWYSVFTWWVWKLTFTWSIFDNSKKIILYNMEWESIWDLNLSDWNIRLSNDGLYLLWTLDTWSLNYSVYEGPTKRIFSIKLPAKEQLRVPEIHKTADYELREIDNSRLWDFDWWYCIYWIHEKLCVLYISKKWLIYTPREYQNVFISDYKFIDWTISSSFYKTSIPSYSSLTEQNKIFTIWYKVKNMWK